MVEDISHEGLRELLRAENVSFRAVKTWKASADPVCSARKARVDHLYAIADGEVPAGPGEPEVVFCVDEFGPLNLQPRPGRQWARRGGTARGPGRGAAAAAAGTDHATHREQGSMIRRYIAGRNRNTSNPRLRRIVERANVA